MAQAIDRPQLLSDLVHNAAKAMPEALALMHKKQSWTYAELAVQITDFAGSLQACGLQRNQRVAIYLPKQVETVVGFFAAVEAAAVAVPVNPLLRPAQVGHILNDSSAHTLVTSGSRLRQLAEVLPLCPELRCIVVTSPAEDFAAPSGVVVRHWSELAATPEPGGECRGRIDSDMAAILYTSGSTGSPRGVVLSHRNMLEGAHSVAGYLHNTREDRLLAVLPFSFDAGLSQMTTAFSVGAALVLMDYLLPRDVIRAVVNYRITGLAAVPPLWNQLRDLEWPPEAAESLRYITNTGGAMPVVTTQALRRALPATELYLMYGLTEAFRSTYLPPDQVDVRPESIGKAIPNAEILVVNERGELCGPNEPGELVHRGALVSMGYWNDPEKTAERFRPCPLRPEEIPTPELAVWSGDQVMRDSEGFLYFIGRKDDMIKSSGYRVSPSEVEEVAYRSCQVSQAAAIGVPHPVLGQAIILLAVLSEVGEQAAGDIAQCYRSEVPSYMVPAHIQLCDDLPRNPNGKIDRVVLRNQYAQFFAGDKS